MKKDAYYFPHDSNSRHDQKMTAMRSKYKCEGYGWYWILIEILREQEGYKLPINDKFSFHSLAHEMQTDIERVKEYINDCIDIYDLLKSDGESIWSNSLLKRMVKVEEKRQQAIDAANKRWGKREQSVSNATAKQSKVKESKVKSSSVGISVLSDKKLWAEFSKEIQESEEFLFLTTKAVESERLKAIDWLKSVGKTYKNYKSFFKNWLRRKIDAENPQDKDDLQHKKGKMVW